MKNQSLLLSRSKELELVAYTDPSYTVGKRYKTRSGLVYPLDYTGDGSDFVELYEPLIAASFLAKLLTSYKKQVFGAGSVKHIDDMYSDFLIYISSSYTNGGGYDPSRTDYPLQFWVGYRAQGYLSEVYNDKNGKRSYRRWFMEDDFYAKYSKYAVVPFSKINAADSPSCCRFSTNIESFISDKYSTGEVWCSAGARQEQDSDVTASYSHTRPNDNGTNPFNNTDYYKVSAANSVIRKFARQNKMQYEDLCLLLSDGIKCHQELNMTRPQAQSVYNRLVNYANSALESAMFL